MIRLILGLALALGTFAACDSDGGSGIDSGPIEEGITPAPRNGGYCCPIDLGTCNCFRNGGWIAKPTDMCPTICDLAPTNTSVTTDEHGCEQLRGPDSCLPPLDAGSP